eukprot:2532150-Pyramimonas_sp.AAC.1
MPSRTRTLASSATSYSLGQHGAATILRGEFALRRAHSTFGKAPLCPTITLAPRRCIFTRRARIGS